MRTTLPRGRRVRRALAAGTAPALVAGLALTVTANPAPATTTDPHPGMASQRHRVPYVSKSIPASHDRRAGTYWTPERMANAIPADHLTDDQMRSPSPATKTDPMEPTTGSRPVTPASLPRGKGRLHKSKTIGKVFFTQHGRHYVCSGAAVNSKRKNMVFTAGHCVHGGGKRGRWSRHWIFVPGYGPGHRRPHGTYRATKLVALRGWVRKRRYNDDVALALVRPGRGTNKKLVKKVGGFGIQFGRRHRRRLAAIGYSDQGKYKGGKQRGCRKRTRGAFHGGSIKMRCRSLRPGASGGPWVKGTVRKGKGYLNGVLSNGNRGPSPVVRSAYFGRDVHRMYKRFRKKR